MLDASAGNGSNGGEGVDATIAMLDE